MNKVRITGIAILVFAIAMGFYLNNDTYDFWLGAAGGTGAILAIVGRINRVG